MNVFFLKHTLTDAQIEAALAYVQKNFGSVPTAPSEDWEGFAQLINVMMNESDLNAWLGHVLSTPFGMVTLARLKLGFGSPGKGLQWLGTRVFVDSCNTLISKGYPPAAADIGSVTYDMVDGTSTRDGRYHGAPAAGDDDLDSYAGHPLG